MNIHTSEAEHVEQPTENADWQYGWEGSSNFDYKILEDPESFMTKTDLYEEHAQQQVHQIVGHAVSTLSHMPNGEPVVLAKINGFPRFQQTGLYDPRTEAQFNATLFWRLVEKHLPEEMNKQGLKNVSIITQLVNTESQGSQLVAIATKAKEEPVEAEAHPASRGWRSSITKLFGR